MSIVNAPIRILISDDHSIVRTGLLVLLEHEFGITDIYEAASCAEVLSSLRQYKPTHLIMDVRFKDGNSIEILPSIKNLFPELHIMAHSMLPSEVYAPAFRRLGVIHYLNKDSSKAQICEQLQQFLDNTRDYKKMAVKKDTLGNPFKRLSTRELEVLHYLLKGESTTAIAIALNLQKSTISTLKNRILEKTHTQNLKGLIDLAMIYDHNL